MSSRMFIFQWIQYSNVCICFLVEKGWCYAICVCAHLHYLFSCFWQHFYLIHCVKSVRIWSYSGLHFPAFGLNMERDFVSLRIQSECGKMLTKITPNRGTFYAVLVTCFICWNLILPLIKKDMLVTNGYFSLTRSISVVIK